MISTDEFENHIYIFQSSENKALEVLQIFDYVGGKFLILQFMIMWPATWLLN